MRALPLVAMFLMSALPLLQAKPPKKKAPPQPSVKKLLAERDQLKAELEACSTSLETSKTAQASAEAQAKASLEDLRRLKTSLEENKSGGDSILADLQKLRDENVELRGANERLKQEAAQLRSQTSADPREGTLLPLTPEVIPAKPLNLNTLTPKLKGFSQPKGTVVVNVLVSEKGEVMATRLLQGLRGEDEKIRQANDACLEAAKKLIFDPATTADGKIRLKVWQGVGFFLD